MDLSEFDYSKKSTIIQVIVSVVANFGLLVNGMTMAFPSAILGPLVESTAPGFHASVNAGSWVASIAHISAPIGCLLGGPVVDRLGRRRGLQLLNVVSITGWLLITLVPRPFPSLVPLLVGRFLTGLGGGLATCAAASYTTEVVTPRLRTMLVMLSPVMMGVGVFIIYLMADLFRDEWNSTANTGLSISILSIVLSTFLPESPLWLLTKNRTEEAQQALMKLRGVKAPQEVEEEFVLLSGNVISQNKKASWSQTFKNMCKPEAYKPFIIMNIFFLFQQTCGISVIIIYGVKFAKDAEVPSDAYTIALFIGIIRVISTFITTWACGRFGRRIPAIAAGIGMTLSLLGLTTYVGLRHKYPTEIPSTTWVPASCIFLNIFTSSVGFSSLPWSMLGEVFPTNVRGVFSGFTSCIAYLFMFISIKFYPIIEPLVGNLAVFAFFGISSLIATIFLALFLPETHGKTLQDIEDYFRDSTQSKKSAV